MATSPSSISDQPDGLWVFGYGSLMWNPGFAYEERVPARLLGAHRAFCVYSVHWRGTHEKPGLVLGLDRGGSCIGIAFRVAPENSEATVTYLREREQVTMVYREATRRIWLRDGSNRSAPALVYLVDRAHSQYAGALDRDQVLQHVRQGHGVGGPNRDYVLSTSDHLAELGIHDPELNWLAQHI